MILIPNRPLVYTTAILKTYSGANIILEGKLLVRVERSNQVKDLALCVVKKHNACIVWKWLATRNETRLESDLSYFRKRETTTKYPWSVSRWSVHSSQQEQNSHWKVNQSFAGLAGPLCHETESWGQEETPRRTRNITQGQIQQLVDTYCTCRQTKWGSTHLWRLYTITVNPQPQTENYPLPRIDDIFAKLAGVEDHQDWLQTGIPSNGSGGRVTRVLNDQHPPGRKYWIGERNMAYEQIVANVSFFRQNYLLRTRCRSPRSTRLKRK